MELLTDDTKTKLVSLIEDDLEFVDAQKDLLCSHCNRIPIFHYIYPCQHPYCRDCYVGVFQKHKKKCRVCKTEIGTQMLQSKKLEFAIYNLKAICPNKIFGCKQEVTLYTILSHLEECKHSEDKVKEAKALHNLKASVEDIKTTLDELVKSNQSLDDKNKKLLEDKEAKDIKMKALKDQMGNMSAEMTALKEEVEHLKNKTQLSHKEVIKLSKDVAADNCKKSEKKLLERVKVEMKRIEKNLKTQKRHFEGTPSAVKKQRVDKIPIKPKEESKVTSFNGTFKHYQTKNWDKFYNEIIKDNAGGYLPLRMCNIHSLLTMSRNGQNDFTIKTEHAGVYDIAFTIGEEFELAMYIGNKKVKCTASLEGNALTILYRCGKWEAAEIYFIKGNELQLTYKYKNVSYIQKYRRQ